MNQNEDHYKALYDVQKKCGDLNHKIDSMIRIMGMFSAYMQYSNLMSDLDPNTVPLSAAERSDSMNPKDLQRLLNTTKQSDQPMSQDEFNRILDTLKQGKSPEEIARMEQMVQMAKNFMK